MQDQVGIVRKEERDGARRVEKHRRGAQAAARTKVAVPGNREYNPGWHTAIDLPNLLIVSEAVARCGHSSGKESRGAHFREDFPGEGVRVGQDHLVLSRGDDGAMQVRREPRSPHARRARAAIIEEMK